MHMTENQISSFVTRYPWTFAKTYAAKASHEYYVKYELDAQGQKDFERFVLFIRENGFSAKFWGEAHIYYEFDGHYYWTMGDPLEDTYILNRCIASEYEVSCGVMEWKERYEHE